MTVEAPTTTVRNNTHRLPACCPPPADLQDNKKGGPEAALFCYAINEDLFLANKVNVCQAVGDIDDA